MNILITGSGNYLGKYLIDNFLKEKYKYNSNIKQENFNKK